MRIVAPDAVSATALAERLAGAFGSDHISLGRGRGEVDVRIDPEPEPVLVRVLDAVERWFEQARVGSIEIRFGERSYKLAQWVRVDT